MKHIVAISGGKDSTALALKLAELNPNVDYTYLCTPVGNEPLELLEHMDRLEKLLGKPILRLKPYGDVDGLQAVIEEQNAIPNFRMRFCTRILKIEPTISFLKENAPCTQYVGLRADEEEREGLYGDIAGVKQRFPFKEIGWGIDEVWSFLDQMGVTVPSRTDCLWCYHQRVIEWWLLWKNYLYSYLAAESFEQEFGHTFRSPGRDTWPTALADLRKEFESGRRPKGADKAQQMTLWNCDKDAMCRVCTL